MNELSIINDSTADQLFCWAAVNVQFRWWVLQRS